MRNYEAVRKAAQRKRRAEALKAAGLCVVVGLVFWAVVSEAGNALDRSMNAHNIPDCGAKCGTYNQ